MHHTIRLFWNLAAIGGAIAVGVLTHDAGLVAVTFLGGLIVPRLLGLSPRGARAFGWGPGACHGRGPGGRWRFERLDSWHRDAHGGEPPSSQQAATSTAV